ncbi:molecular chaperone DnaK (HSP70) [Allocatelliglobosispora scoriae]|uniref:Molecular chaperone DnaK (HSP70) n=1 Tax=Allocatelliglobosispora scoriae TaxID=643052 RepID=A0A841C280_9ACTN|nr:Hsp70 family protein [Allocatelliglobosispora scoriae]MBB5872971.1 molecular chaperone DnaK (HSP70) [Allocatelliglobosispora scoriae]
MTQENTAYFGIDLGTTYSAIAYIDDTGRPTVIRDQIGESLTMPSVVFFESAENVVVGAGAREMAKILPEQVVERVKRQMGREAQWEFFQRTHTPESISALILRNMADYAREFTQREVKQVVITVPAYFGMLERNATRTAGEIAGLDVIGIVPEPVAAALQYEVMDGSPEKTILVYDLGGGTFDTTVIRITADEITVLCTDGDQELGGTDWDDRLAQHLLQEVVSATGATENPEEDLAFMAELYATAEKTKRQLSQAESRPVVLRFAGKPVNLVLTRTVFEDLTRDLVDRTIEITHRTLAALGEKIGSAAPKSAIDEVLLVGGSTKMPIVAARLTQEFGWTPQMHDPDLAVAKGAARFALSQAVWHEEAGPTASGEPRGALTPAQREKRIEELSEQTGIPGAAIALVSEKKITNVLPKAFGVKLYDTRKNGPEADPDSFYIHHLVHANDTLPSGPHVLDAETMVANQQSVMIEIYEQAGSTESPDVSANKSVDRGNGTIEPLPPLPAGSPIKITMEINSEGRLALHAVEPVSRRELTIEVQVNVLSDAEIAPLKSMVSSIAVRS